MNNTVGPIPSQLGFAANGKMSTGFAEALMQRLTRSQCDACHFIHSFTRRSMSGRILVEMSVLRSIVAFQVPP